MFGKYSLFLRKRTKDKIDNSIHRVIVCIQHNVCNFILKIFISLIKMYMHGTRYHVTVDKSLSDEFEVITGLKQRDSH